MNNLHNNAFAHGTVINEDDDNHVSGSKGWAKLIPIQSLLTLSAPIGQQLRCSPSRTRSYPHAAKLIITYQIRGTKLHFMLARLLGFMLDNRGGLVPKIDST